MCTLSQSLLYLNFLLAPLGGDPLTLDTLALKFFSLLLLMYAHVYAFVWVRTYVCVYVWMYVRVCVSSIRLLSSSVRFCS